MYRTASSLAFFGLLRSAEYTCVTRTSFAVSHTLLVQDISFRSSNTIMEVFIRASKTDPFRVGCTIRIAAIDDVLCPVRLMLEYLTLHPTSVGPLFVSSANRYLGVHSHR